MTDDIPAFMFLAQQLKRVYRQGWIDRGVANPESSAGHSWSLALLAWLLAADRPALDRERVLLLALIHDLPEAIAGDATPFDRFRDSSGVIPDQHFKQVPHYDELAHQQKSASEAAGLNEMLQHLSVQLRAELQTAWHEYQAAETREARFVKQLDKVETLIQAILYKREQPEIVIESFHKGAQRDVSDPQLRRIIELLRDLEG